MSKCEKCIYYYTETNFCLNHMYTAKNPAECTDFKDNSSYNMNTIIKNSDLEFSEEITDGMGDDLTIGGLFYYIDNIMEELL